MSVTHDKKYSSLVNSSIYSQDLVQTSTRNLTHPWGIYPLTYLEEVRQQSRTNKFIALRESLAAMAQSSSSSNVEQQQQILSDITNTLENLKTMRAIVLSLKESDIESATQFGKDTMMIIAELLLHVVKQIGQTNVQTPTFESIIAYIRNLIHTRSAYMRQTIPRLLLISWYDLSQLILSMQNEPELRITIKKAKQLLDIAHDTAAWVYKQLSMKSSNTDPIDFIDRNNISYTYE